MSRPFKPSRRRAATSISDCSSRPACARTSARAWSRVIAPQRAEARASSKLDGIDEVDTCIDEPACAASASYRRNHLFGEPADRVVIVRGVDYRYEVRDARFDEFMYLVAKLFDRAYQ